MSLPEEFVFSQSALQDYIDCPRRFELRYLLDVRWPALETASALEHETHMLKGQEFHRLLHQHAVGIPAQTLEATLRDDEIRAWWEQYLHWQAALPAKRFPELTLTAPIGETLLMAKYDLVTRLPDGSFLIVDWKTGKAQRRGLLAMRMQTLVYPYVLARAGDWLNDNKPIPPERIKMVYWFAEASETVEFSSNAEKLRVDEDQLTSIIGEISARFEFPLTHELRQCRFCPYRSLCERGERAGDLQELIADGEEDDSGKITFDLDDIEEVSF